MKIQKRRQQGRGSTGKRYQECPKCGQYYLRSMYVLDRDPMRQGSRKGKWVKIGLYCEGCGKSWTYREKELSQEMGMDYDI
jgi:transcription elongation factor Elf1